MTAETIFILSHFFVKIVKEQVEHNRVHDWDYLVINVVDQSISSPIIRSIVGLYFFSKKTQVYRSKNCIDIKDRRIAKFPNDSSTRILSGPRKITNECILD